MGVPVVTVNSGGMAELVEDGKTGGLAQEATVDAVADTVKKCMNDSYYQTLKEGCEAASEKIIGVKEYCGILIQKYQDLKTKR